MTETVEQACPFSYEIDMSKGDLIDMDGGQACKTILTKSKKEPFSCDMYSESTMAIDSKFSTVSEFEAFDIMKNDEERDFNPEPTFRTLATYKLALCQTFPRLKDCLADRSTDSTELVELKKQSENEMKKCLTWWDLIWLGFGSVVGSGIFSLTGQEAPNDAGPAITISYAVSGFSTLLSVFYYTEFVVEIPVTGGSFSFLRIELGGDSMHLTLIHGLLPALFSRHRN
ncbi:hypothetical protein RJ639_022855, partial [Escallonia herrerae]